MFLSDLGSNPFIIDDSNAWELARDVQDPQKQQFTGGYDTTNFQQAITDRFASPFTGDVIPRSHWDAHIERQEMDESSPDHWRKAGNVPVLDQGSWGYCWMYGTVGAIMTAYAQQGLQVPRLSAMAPAYQGKRGRNVGGWAGEALEYIDKYGLPTDAVWPNRQADRSGQLAKSEAVKRSAAMHAVADFEVLPKQSFDHLATALLDPENPRPVTLGLSWWGHLIYATKLVKIGSGKYGALIVNSWKESWGNQGTGILTEQKAIAFEQIAVKRVKPSAA